MLAETTIERLQPLLTNSQALLAYYVAPLPPGTPSAQGGLAVLFAAGAASQPDQPRRLRLSLAELLPAGQTELIVLDDSRLSVAADVIERGALVYSADEHQRVRYEMLVLSRMLDFEQAAQRFFTDGASSAGRQLP
jgi:hypothetical protein